MMHSKNIPLFFIVASLTSTSLGFHHLVVTARRSLDIILARQTNSSPCASICGTVESSVTSCTSPSCICTSAIAASVQACANCAVENDNSRASVTSAQNLVASFENLCSTVAGVPTVTININTATLPGPGMRTTIVPSASSSTASIGGLPLKSTASPKKIIFHWTVALLGLAAGNLLVF